jgi:hypothetical protein
MSSNNKILVVHMAVGLDLIGSKTSLHDSKYDIEATSIGVKATSRTSGRTIVIPYSNVKGFEMKPDDGVVTKSSSASRTAQALAEARNVPVAQVHRELAEKEQAAQLSEAQQAEQAKAARQAARAKAKAEAEAQNADKK